MYESVHFTSSLPDLLSNVMFDNLLNGTWSLGLYSPRSTPEARVLVQIVYLKSDHRKYH